MSQVYRTHTYIYVCISIYIYIYLHVDIIGHINFDGLNITYAGAVDRDFGM